jgi:hypothetical protein
MTAAAQLTLNTWANGNLTASGTEWFKFTATAARQYIHVARGSLTNLYVQLRNSNGNMVGSATRMYEYNDCMYADVTVGEEYYIEVYLYSTSYSGTYKIGFTTSQNITPDVADGMSSATVLTAGAWTDGNLPASGVQWFKLTMTASTQYIHVARGSLTNLYIQLRNSNGNTVGSAVRMYEYNSYTSLSGFPGEVYYVQVYPYSTSYSGTYKITFNTSSTLPAAN